MKVQPWFAFGDAYGPYGQGQAAAYFAAMCPIDGAAAGAVPGEATEWGPWVTPAADPAVWYDAVIPASAGFLGLWVDAVTGVDAPVTQRSSVTLATGGSTAGAWSTSARGLTITGLLFAVDSASMLYGQRWLVREMLRATDTHLDVLLGDASDAAAYRSLYDVQVAEPPRFTLVDGGEVDGEQVVCQFEFVLVAGDPHLYARTTLPTVPAVTGNPSAGLAVADTAVTCVTATAPYDLACDPLATLPLLPYGALFDRWGRPSCGSGSADYLNGIETVKYDSKGRPSSGEDSGFWLDGDPEIPVFDYLRRPSCGAGSAGFGASSGSLTGNYDTVFVGAASLDGFEWIQQTITCPTLVEPAAFLSGNSALLNTFVTGSPEMRNLSVSILGVNEHDTRSPFLYASGRLFTNNAQSTAQSIDLGALFPQSNGTRVVRMDCRYEVTFQFEYRQASGQSFQIELDAFGSATSGAAYRPCDGVVAGPNAGTDRTVADACVAAISATATTVTGGLPNGYAERSLFDRFGGLDQWLHPTGASTPADEAKWRGNVGAALAAIGAEMDVSAMAGTVTPSGFAWATLTFAGLTSSICAGSDVRWLRLRARAWSPVNGIGPAEMGNPESAWTLRAVLDNGAGTVAPIDGAGEFMSTSEWAGEERAWVFRVAQADLGKVRVVSSFAAQGSPAATPGRLEFVTIDAEYVGGGGCADCGPNVADVDCTASSPFPRSCWVEPAAVHVLAGICEPGDFSDLVPRLQLTAAGAVAKNVRVQWWDTQPGHTHPAASLGEWEWWHCADPISVMEIAEIPANWRLVVNGAERTIQLRPVIGTAVLDAASLVTGPLGAPWVWPLFRGPVVVSVESDNTAPLSAASATFTQRDQVDSS